MTYGEGGKMPPEVNGPSPARTREACGGCAWFERGPDNRGQLVRWGSCLLMPPQMYVHPAGGKVEWITPTVTDDHRCSMHELDPALARIEQASIRDAFAKVLGAQP